MRDIIIIYKSGAQRRSWAADIGIYMASGEVVEGEKSPSRSTGSYLQGRKDENTAELAFETEK